MTELTRNNELLIVRIAGVPFSFASGLPNYTVATSVTELLGGGPWKPYIREIPDLISASIKPLGGKSSDVAAAIDLTIPSFMQPEIRQFIIPGTAKPIRGFGGGVGSELRVDRPIGENDSTIYVNQNSYTDPVTDEPSVVPGTKLYIGEECMEALTGVQVNDGVYSIDVLRPVRGTINHEFILRGADPLWGPIIWASPNTLDGAVVRMSLVSRFADSPADERRIFTGEVLRITDSDEDIRIEITSSLNRLKTISFEPDRAVLNALSPSGCPQFPYGDGGDGAGPSLLQLTSGNLNAGHFIDRDQATPDGSEGWKGFDSWRYPTDPAEWEFVTGWLEEVSDISDRPDPKASERVENETHWVVQPVVPAELSISGFPGLVWTFEVEGGASDSVPHIAWGKGPFIRDGYNPDDRSDEKPNNSDGSGYQAYIIERTPYWTGSGTWLGLRSLIPSLLRGDWEGLRAAYPVDAIDLDQIDDVLTGVSPSSVLTDADPTIESGGKRLYPAASVEMPTLNELLCDNLRSLGMGLICLANGKVGLVDWLRNTQDGVIGPEQLAAPKTRKSFAWDGRLKSVRMEKVFAPDGVDYRETDLLFLSESHTDTTARGDIRTIKPTCWTSWAQSGVVADRWIPLLSRYQYNYPEIEPRVFDARSGGVDVEPGKIYAITIPESFGPDGTKPLQGVWGVAIEVGSRLVDGTQACVFLLVGWGL